MIEVGFIIFLFYSNLLMSEFTRTNRDGKTFLFAIKDIFTSTNFEVAVVSGLIGYVVVEYLRKKLYPSLRLRSLPATRTGGLFGV
jgi:hypothetical protein